MTETTGPILVPLDGSKAAEQALPAAKVLSEQHKAPIVFIHVVDPDDYPSGEDFAKARDTFATYASEMGERVGITESSSHVAEGKPGPTILRYAREHLATTIVIASHGRGGFQSIFIGSVADRVTRGAECPVMLIPATRDNELHSPVLVALDGSPESEVALEAGRALAAHLGAKVVIMSAYRMPPPVGVEFSYYSPSMIDSFREATEQYLAKIAGKDETAYAVQGPASSAITETANQVDAGAVVMASSGKGLAERLTIGSTTSRVMHSLHRPLLIVPSGE